LLMCGVMKQAYERAGLQAAKAESGRGGRREEGDDWETVTSTCRTPFGKQAH